MIKTKSLLNTFIFLFIALVINNLSGCGYNLRGYNDLPLNIQSIYIDYAKIQNNEVNNKFIHNLSNELRSQDIKVITDRINQEQYQGKYKAKYQLKITSVNYTKNIISTSSSKLISQYKLLFNTSFNLYKNNKPILTNQVINTQRNYNYTQDQILGLQSEENAITNEIIQESIDRIITQLTIATKQ